jgi:hypothetical protein
MRDMEILKARLVSRSEKSAKIFHPYFFLQMFKLRWICQHCCCRLSRLRSSCCSNSIRISSCRLSSSSSGNKSADDSQLESDENGSLPSALLVSTRNSSTQFKVFSPELSAGEVTETDRSVILIIVSWYRYLFVDFSGNLDEILRASAFCEALEASGRAYETRHCGTEIFKTKRPHRSGALY